jgi:hypothetical protein
MRNACFRVMFALYMATSSHMFDRTDFVLEALAIGKQCSGLVLTFGISSIRLASSVAAKRCEGLL